jgi:ligand-binding sensor domain-containing protein/serine phosphatase RsbU (regulator of sigma subunit)
MHVFLKWILFVVGLHHALLHAQTYNFKNYTTKQGLPQSQVLAIFQDHNGVMWFGTNSGGLGRYDGNDFSTISTNDGLINNDVYSIAEDESGNLLLGTNKGLSVYNGASFRNYGKQQGLENNSIFKLLQDKDVTWIGTQEGVYQYSKGRIIPFRKNELLNKSSVYSIFIDASRNIWFATFQNGVIYYDRSKDAFRHFSTANGLMNDFIFSIGQSKNGDILVGTQTGLNIINPRFEVRNADELFKNENISYSYILASNSDTVLFGTYSEGILAVDFSQKKRILQYNHLNGLTNNAILCLFKDREGNLWIGTDGTGAFKYSNAKFVYYTKADGLPENYVNAIAQDKKGDYWIALRSNGLFRTDGTHTKSYNFSMNKPNTLPDNNINTILAASDKLFFGTNDGLCTFENEGFRNIASPVFNHKYILSLYEDNRKNIWIGTSEGAFKYTDGTVSEVEIINKFRQEGQQFAINCITGDQNGHIWFGIEHGLIELDQRGGCTLLNDKNQFHDINVLSATRDRHNNLWFGTSEGLFRFDHKAFSKISQKNGLSSNNVLFLQVDNLNRLIIGLNTGLDVLDLTEYEKNHVNVKHFGRDDGLLTLEANFNAVFKDKEGRILIGTPNGLEIYNPLFDSKNTLEPLTHINSVKLFFGQENIYKYGKLDTLTQLPKNLSLSFSKNHLTFQFVGISLSAPEKVMYQYKLEGLDNDWTPPTSKTEATYSSLPPGKYKFMLKAMNNDGVWNEEPAVFEFEISPPWYNTWWFYSICAILLVSGISIYNYVRTKKLIADKQKLEKVVDERTRELRDEKEKVESINKEVTEQKSIIEHKNVEITDSIKYAKNIQEALLPNLSNIHSMFGQSFVLYMPKDIVSGDFYWFAKNGDTRFIAAVDCTGHGVPGAFMSIVGNTLLNEIVNEKKITRPGDILLELHKGVKIALNQNAQEFERRDGMDITLCAFTDNSPNVEYAGANRPLWIYRKSRNYELEIIKASKFPIGGLELEEHRVYESHVIAVEEGDCLYLFSDGYADQFGGPKGKKFMLTNLQKTLRNMVELPMSQQRQKLENTFLDWKQDTEQIDDVLVIGIRI